MQPITATAGARLALGCCQLMRRIASTFSPWDRFENTDQHLESIRPSRGPPRHQTPDAASVHYSASVLSNASVERPVSLLPSLTVIASIILYFREMSLTSERCNRACSAIRSCASWNALKNRCIVVGEARAFFDWYLIGRKWTTICQVSRGSSWRRKTARIPQFTSSFSSDCRAQNEANTYCR